MGVGRETEEQQDERIYREWGEFKDALHERGEECRNLRKEVTRLERENVELRHEVKVLVRASMTGGVE